MPVFMFQSYVDADEREITVEVDTISLGDADYGFDTKIEYSCIEKDGGEYKPTTKEQERLWDECLEHYDDAYDGKGRAYADY